MERDEKYKVNGGWSLRPARLRTQKWLGIQVLQSKWDQKDPLRTGCLASDSVLKTVSWVTGNNADLESGTWTKPPWLINFLCDISDITQNWESWTTFRKPALRLGSPGSEFRQVQRKKMDRKIPLKDKPVKKTDIQTVSKLNS